MNVTPLAHDEFRATIQRYVDGGTPNEHDLGELLLGIYDRSCEQPRVVSFVNEWCLGALNRVA